MSLCDTFWGTHACDLDTGHATSIHGCYAFGDPCSQFDPVNKQARYWLADEGKWSEWMHREEWPS